MPQYGPDRFTKDGRLRAPLHLVGPRRDRSRIPFGPAATVSAIILYMAKRKYDEYSSITPLQQFLGKVRIAPYGVLGTQLSMQGGLVEVAETPNEQTVITDPAGLHHIRGVAEGAGGAAGSIYKWLGLTGPFPSEVKAAVQGVGDAKYFEYPGGKKVIHTVGPDFRQGKWSEREATIELSRAYRNILHEHVISNGERLRLLPVSAGIFSGYLYDQMPRITQDALAAGFEQLHPYDKKYLSEGKGGEIELCIFMNREWDMYKTVFANLKPPSKL